MQPETRNLTVFDSWSRSGKEGEGTQLLSNGELGPAISPLMRDGPDLHA
jgi:hypothetical protein